MAAEDSNLAETVQEISERASALVREEIELAKAEITEKVTKLVKGAVVAIAASIFAVVGLLFALHGFAWLAWFILPVGDSAIFWGFFVVAGLLFIMAGVAGYLAKRFVQGGQPPVPEMAIDEAQRIKETVKQARS